MKINCLHGYFTFEEVRPGEVSRFLAAFRELNIIRQNGVFTFYDLKDAPEYSFKNAPLLDSIAIKNYEGHPWEVFKQNKVVYDFNQGLVVPITSITKTVQLFNAGNSFVSPGLILPGSLTEEGKRVTDYAAWFSTDIMRFKYSEVTSV